jgi:hypothetical protein
MIIEKYLGGEGKLFIQEDFGRDVINHDRAFIICDRRIGTVLFPHESPPALGEPVAGFSEVI